MALTSVSYNYNVAKVIDTPWNTIINGLNYTKTNLAPLGLKYTLANNVDNGMLLKEIAGNSIQTSVPIEDFSWSNAVVDYTDTNKYWICNTAHKTREETGPFIYCAEKFTDENGFDYSYLSDCIASSKTKNCSQIFYQDANYIYVYVSSCYTSSGGYAYIYRFEKNNNQLVLNKTYSHSNGIISLLDIKDGYIYYLVQYGSSSITKNIRAIEISTGIERSVGSQVISKFGILTSYPSNIVDEEFYIMDMATTSWYKVSFENERTVLNFVPMICTDDISTYSESTSFSYIGHLKRFNRIYTVENKKYLACITLNSYSYSTTSTKIKSTLQLYEITEDELCKKQEIILSGFSLIPKNDWNTLFIGTVAGLRVFDWNPLNANFIEKPQIPGTIQEFGFDLDERLWIMDEIGNIYRYTYNQPLTIDYKFEKERYTLGTETIKTYVDVRIFNYMGELLTSSILLKANGNFVFENQTKTLQIQLSSEDYVRIPVYITGAGKYEIRI